MLSHFFNSQVSAIENQIMEEISKIVQNGFKDVFTGTSKIASLIVLNHCLKNSEDVLGIIKSVSSSLFYKTINYSKHNDEYLELRKWIEEHPDVMLQENYYILILKGFPIYTEKNIIDSKIYYIPKLHQQVINEIKKNRTRDKSIIKYIGDGCNLSTPLKLYPNGFISGYNSNIAEYIKTYTILENATRENKISVLLVEGPSNSDYDLIYNSINQLDEVSHLQVVKDQNLTDFDKYFTVLSRIPNEAEKSTVVIFHKIDMVLERFLRSTEGVESVLKQRIFNDLLSLLDSRLSGPTVVILHVRNIDYFEGFFNDKLYCFKFEKYSKIDICNCLKYYNEIFLSTECLNKFYCPSLDTILLNLSDDVRISYRSLMVLLFKEFFDYPRIIDVLNSEFIKQFDVVSSSTNSVKNDKNSGIMSIPKVLCNGCDASVTQDLFKLGIKKCVPCRNVKEECSICLTSGIFKYSIKNETSYLCKGCAEKLIDLYDIEIVYNCSCTFVKDRRLCGIKLIQSIDLSHFTTQGHHLCEMCSTCNNKWCGDCREMLDMTNCYISCNGLKVCSKCTSKGNIKYQQEQTNYEKGICFKCNGKASSDRVLCKKCKYRSYAENLCTYCGMIGVIGYLRGMEACKSCMDSSPEKKRKNIHKYYSCKNCETKVFAEGCIEGYTKSTCYWCNIGVCDVCINPLGENDYFILSTVRIHERCIVECSDAVKNKFKNLKIDGVRCIKCANTLKSCDITVGSKICGSCSTYNPNLGCVRCLEVEPNVELYVLTYIYQNTLTHPNSHICIHCMKWVHQYFPTIYAFRHKDYNCKKCYCPYHFDVVGGKLIIGDICQEEECIKDRCFNCGETNPTYEAPSINRLVCEKCKYSCQDIVSPSELVHVIKT